MAATKSSEVRVREEQRVIEFFNQHL